MATKQIPGPKSNLASRAAELKKQPLDFMISVIKDYPSIAEIKILHRTLVIIADPKLVREILQTKQKYYSKSSIYEHLKLILGEGLVTSEGEMWKRQRKLIQPSFHKQYINNLFNTMLACTNEMIGEWDEKAESGERFDIAEEMKSVTLQIISKTMLSTDVKTEARPISTSLAYMGGAIKDKTVKLINFPLWVPTPSNMAFKSHRKVLDNIIYKIIAERKKSGNDKGDLLDMLMLSRYEDTGEPMPDNLLRDELMTIFIAGHSTTATALAWTFYLISQHEEVYKKLKKEVDEVIGDGEITFEHLQQLKYSKACFNEGMRIYPPIWLIGRQANEDNQVGDYTIKKGTDVLISPYIVHHNAAYWKNPDTFDPDRWETDEVKEIDKFAYFPFAAGPRMCIGNNFALLEAEIVMAKVIQTFDFEYSNKVPPIMDPSTTLRMKHGVFIKVKRRK